MRSDGSLHLPSAVDETPPPAGMLLSEARRRFPATYALYRQESSPEGFGLFLIRTASSVHGRSRRGVSTGVGSGNRMMWTADHLRAAAVKLLMARQFGNVKAAISVEFETLRCARWKPEAGEVVVQLPSARLILDAPPELMAEHGR